MTVSSIIPVNNYAGNSSTTRFDFDFLIERESELVVQHISSDGVINTLQYNVDYSINEIGNRNGSYITFPLENSSYGVLQSDEKISLILELDIKQENEFRNSLYYNIEVIEWTYDYIIRILQILARRIERCVKVNEGSSSTPDSLLNELNAAKNLAVTSAQNASTSAQNASTSAQNAADSEQAAENSVSIIDDKAEEFLLEYQQCLSDILNLGINTRSTISLDNLSETGEKHFLNKTQISNCILEAPNGVLEYSNGVLTIKAGIKALLPNGRNADGSLKSIEYIPQNDLSANVSATACKYVFLNNSNLIITSENYYESDNEPLNAPIRSVWYSQKENKAYYKVTSETWANEPLTILGCITSSQNAVSYAPVSLASSANVDGQWVQKYLEVSTATSIASREHDLSSYLPDDCFDYEVMVHVAGSTLDSSSGGSCGYRVGTVASPDTNRTGCFSFGVYVTTNSTQGRNTAILPVNTTRKIYSQISSHALNSASIILIGYRRIGTNV